MNDISRRGFLYTGGSAALMPGAAAEPRPALPAGATLRLQPVLVWQLNQRRELTSWRQYGGLGAREDVDAEARRIADELKQLAARAEFPVAIEPVVLAGSAAESAAAAAADCDALMVFASAGPVGWYEALAASGKPNIMFLRHRSGPFYLYYEIAHFRFLRKSDDRCSEPHMDVDDVVVDDYGDVLWRLRALYGLKNARGTRCLALGGLRAYTATGQNAGPEHVKRVWNYDIVSFPDEELEKRVQRARSDSGAVARANREADALVSEKGVTLRTEKRFVANSYLALHVIEDLMKETGASNVGVANCMGSLIRLLDTPPCLVLSLLNDAGYTAFCHTDFTHTPPGVLLRWISGKPSFVSNSHFPHHGTMTLAHCATPRRMNGRDCEPTTIMTHFESDYGAATRVEFTKGQVLTNLIPNFACTKWFGFRGKIVATPDYPACRSQIDMTVEGDWRRLLRELEGFHTVTCYGDYLREVGYALKKTAIAWENIS